MSENDTGTHDKKKALSIFSTLFAFLGFVLGLFAETLAKPFFGGTFRSSDIAEILDPLVTLIVGLFITRKVAEWQARTDAQLKQQQLEAERESVDYRVLKDMVLRQMENYLKILEGLHFVITDVHRQGFSQTTRQTVQTTTKKLNTDWIRLTDTLNDFSMTQVLGAANELNVLIQEYTESLTGGQYDRYSLQEWLVIVEHYKTIQRKLTQLMYLINSATPKTKAHIEPSDAGFGI